jgi:hypothetical protein
LVDGQLALACRQGEDAQSAHDRLALAHAFAFTPGREDLRF